MRQTNTLDFKTTVKVIGASGQISLGKQFAGRQVLVEAQDEGVWLIRTAQVVPDNERWLHEEAFQARLKKSLDWAKSHAPEETENPVAYLEKLQHGRSHKT